MVRWLMVPFVCAICLILVAEGTGQDKKKKATSITGAVTAVDASKDSKDSGTIIVKTPEKKKKDVVTAEAKEHKIEVTKETKIEKAPAKKDEKATPATFADLDKGQNVTVAVDAGKALSILILAKKK